MKRWTGQMLLVLVIGCTPDLTIRLSEGVYGDNASGLSFRVKTKRDIHPEELQLLAVSRYGPEDDEQGIPRIGEGGHGEECTASNENRIYADTEDDVLIDDFQGLATNCYNGAMWDQEARPFRVRKIYAWIDGDELDCIRESDTGDPIFFNCRFWER